MTSAASIRTQPPPLLLGLALALWGLTSGQLALAAAAACAVEAPRWLHWRLALTERDFQRTADLCTLLTVGLLIALFADSRHFPNALVQLLGWLPLLFLVLILAQRYSTSGRVPISALFWSLRKRREQGSRAVPFDYAYFGLCLIAASAANVRAQWHFPAVLAVGLYALWPLAPAGRRPLAWLASAGTAGMIGFALQVGLSHGQTELQELVFEWLDARWRAPADPYRARTAIGDLGVLKASERIVMRLAADGPPPPLLRGASYPTYVAGGWSAAEAAYPFRPLTEDSDGWRIARGAGRPVRLSAWLDDGRALLALPLGTYRLNALHVARAERNGLGAVRVQEGPQPLALTAWFDAAPAADALPDAADLVVPAALQPVLDAVTAEIGPTRGAPAATVQALGTFFETRFRYSLELGERGGAPRSLRSFLLDDRRGHCEYFATATVLLLRHAGIPARYATGYAVQEYSALERQYVIRARHAHAWALAWLDGRWQPLDTTPSIWAEAEADSGSPLRPVYDVLSWLNYRFAVWRLQDETDSAPARWLWLLLAPAAYVAWRVYRRRLSMVATNRRGRPDAAAGARSDAMLSGVLARLAALGFVRPPASPLLRWVQTLPLRDAQARALLASVVRLYYRQRFDPTAPRDPAGVQRRASELIAMLGRTPR